MMITAYSTIDFVVSDHSPCVPELKSGDFMSAWGGVSGLGLGLPLLWTELGDQAGLAKLVECMGSRQAKQVGLDGKKGVLAVGADADFVVFHPTAMRGVTKASDFLWTVAEDRLGFTEIQEQGLALHRTDTTGSGGADVSTWQAGLGPV